MTRAMDAGMGQRTRRCACTARNGLLRSRASRSVAALLLAGDGELFVLNAVGLGLSALLLRRLTRLGGRQRTGPVQQGQRQQATGARLQQLTAKAPQHEGGHDNDASDDDWWDWDKAAGQPGRAGRPADGGPVQG